MYIFRRQDNDELITVPFETMMEQDSAGYIKLKDGVLARRCVHLEGKTKKPKAVHCGINKFDLTFSLGFSKKQLPTMRAAAEREGFTGVEFYEDPQNKNMVGIRCSSEAERERYIKHRGAFNKTGTLGAGKIGKADLEMAQKLVRERYGKEEAGQDSGPASRATQGAGSDS